MKRDANAKRMELAVLACHSAASADNPGANSVAGDALEIGRASGTHECLHRLTPRELDVLRLLCEGLPNKLISRTLNISESTVKCHVSSILKELRVNSRLQAVVVARRSLFGA